MQTGGIFHWHSFWPVRLLRSEVNLPIIRELLPHYLQDNIKVKAWISKIAFFYFCSYFRRFNYLILQERLDYAEDGRMVFKLRLRVCSTLYPANDGIRDFFVEYDRHVLQTSPPWGSELLEVYIISSKFMECVTFVYIKWS
jgi:hypothetical protein